MATTSESLCAPPVTPLSFSLLITSPIRRNLPFVPTSSVILPLGRVNLPYAGLVVAGLDILMNFLVKRSWIEATPPQRVPMDSQSITLTFAQLAELIQRVSEGTTRPNNTLNGPPPDLRDDEPLFPDHLSFSLSVSGPFGNFDGTPDSSFNVPLFQIPGVPGNLIIAVITLIAQFFIEQANLSPAPVPRGGGS